MRYYIISLYDRFKHDKGTIDEPNYKQIYNSANKQYKIGMKEVNMLVNENKTIANNLKTNLKQLGLGQSLNLVWITVKI